MKNKNTTNHRKILRVIEKIKGLVDDPSIFYNGKCVQLALLLLELYPAGQILWDEDHAIFELEDTCYDIGGVALKNKNHIPLMDYGLLRVLDVMNYNK